MNQFYRNLALWLVICLVMIMVYNMVTQPEKELKPISYTTFIVAVEEGRVRDITVQGATIEGS